MTVCAVVGGQYGSEGKGLIAAHIAEQYGHHVRVGAANAGHTFYTQRPGDRVWEKHVMQQVPCAAYANPMAGLYIGPGAIISHDILWREMETLRVWRRYQQLPEAEVIVDPRAHVVLPEHIEREQGTDLMRRIGSTSATAGEGIGAAQAARIMREGTCQTAADWYNGGFAGIHIAEVPPRLWDVGDGILLEGTQGTGLSLVTGQFPYVTSRATTAPALCAEVGVPKADRVILVVRTHPIRVAENSGPFYEGSREIEWADIGVNAELERTTVTKKVRRVATLSLPQIDEAARLNGATEVAVTHVDYVDKSFRHVAGRMFDPNQIKGTLADLLSGIEEAAGVPVTMLGTGPHHVIDLAEAEEAAA